MLNNLTIVRSILMDAFDGFRPAADALGIPSSTVQRWARDGRIPHWRRDGILKAARKRKIKFNDAQTAYLRSKQREPKLPPTSSNAGSNSETSEDQQSYSLAVHAYIEGFMR